MEGKAMQNSSQAPLFGGEEKLELGPVNDPSLIILLDLNFTLVANNDLKKKSKAPYSDKILQETYRLELVELIRGHTVLLCTVRKETYRDLTLRTIAQKCTGWQPHEAYFNPTDTWYGDIVKAEYLEKLIFPKYGTLDKQQYYAIESATRTRGMYKRYGIPTDPVGKRDEMDALAVLHQVKRHGLAERKRLQLFASQDDGCWHILAMALRRAG